MVTIERAKGSKSATTENMRSSGSGFLRNRGSCAGSQKNSCQMFTLAASARTTILTKNKTPGAFRGGEAMRYKRQVNFPNLGRAPCGVQWQRTTCTLVRKIKRKEREWNGKERGDC